MVTKDYIADKYKLDFSQRRVHIPGIGRNELAQMFKELGFNKGVEVGTEGGKYARVLLNANPDMTLYCIDPWIVYADGGGYKPHVRQPEYDLYYENAKKRTGAFDCFLVRDFSMNVVKDFKDNSIDFVYIDGNHRLDYVVNDIVNWTEKVKPGGIVAGHDFIKQAGQHSSHVPYAVEAYVQSYFVNNYFVLDQKSKITEPRNVGLDRIRSWFFIKDDTK